MIRYICMFILLFCFLGCDKHPWNNPYPDSEFTANIRYGAFSAPPKTLDPARSYSVDEAMFIAQIYEPPLQYHFLKRPYVLVPLTAAAMPKVRYYDKEGHSLPNDAPDAQVAFSVYEIAIKPRIFYQPHPAFAKNQNGQYYYLNQNKLFHHKQLSDFKHKGSRELSAEDYVYEIKRLAKPGVNSPILGLMSTKIIGLDNYAKLLAKESARKSFLDLRQYPLAGAYALDQYHYRIVLKNKYPQFIFWLTMPFFSPIPWEVDNFYSKPGMEENNIKFDWHPVGTGPYLLKENNPNRKMVLEKNPNFHGELYPSEGSASDLAQGYLNLAGKPLPFIDKVVYSLDKEYIPRWNKFLQGYYDVSTVSSDSFDQAIQIDKKGNPYLTKMLKQMGVRLQTTITPSLSYLGFNMMDEVVGGHSERARKLRLAIAIAVNYEEFISIFLNGRGIPAQGPIPPGIFGFVGGKEGINPYVYTWKNNEPKRKPLQEAKKLLQEAGYANGIDPKTGAPLVLNYDVPTSGGPDEKAVLNWMREQFSKLGIQLNIRATEYNRFQEKIRIGQAQIFFWGWVADYPDPENFLFLLYGPNSKVGTNGENATNYKNKEFDRLFEEMKNLPNTMQRQQLINQMVEIARYDSPMIFGVHVEDIVLSHRWDYPTKPNVIAYNTLKYQKIDPVLRATLRTRWNKRILWPLLVIVLVFFILSLPVFVRYLQKERQSIKEVSDIKD